MRPLEANSQWYLGQSLGNGFTALLQPFSVSHCWKNRTDYSCPDRRPVRDMNHTSAPLLSLDHVHDGLFTLFTSGGIIKRIAACNTGHWNDSSPLCVLLHTTAINQPLLVATLLAHEVFLQSSDRFCPSYMSMLSDCWQHRHFTIDFLGTQHRLCFMPCSFLQAILYMSPVWRTSIQSTLKHKDSSLNLLQDWSLAISRLRGE